MPDITLEEKKKRNSLIGKSWEYLCDNFHKFSQDNRIRIALEITKKNMPTVIEGGDRRIVYVINNGNTKRCEDNRVNLRAALEPVEDTQ